MPTSDIALILRVYLITFGLQILGFPIAKKMFGNLPDAGFAVARIVFTLFAAIIIWQVGNLGLGINTFQGLMMVCAGIMALNLWIILKNGVGFLKVSRESLRLIVLEEYLFLTGFAGMCIVRSFNPNIDSLEKFMDFGFTNSYLNSPTLPAPDMWQAGKAINYYSFGHYFASILIRFFSVKPSIGYNLVLAFIAGQSLMMSFAIAQYLSGAKKGIAVLIAGLSGAIGTVLAGNTHILWYLFTSRNLEGYWYADATRFIHNTIHEFPSYSFVVADLHGHLLDLPIVLTFIYIFLQWINSRKIYEEIIMGILFGVMMMTNTWDVAVYGLFLIVASMFLLFKDKHNFMRLIRSAGVMLLFMFLTSLSWFINFQSISSGIMTVTLRSPLWQLAALWSGGAFVVFVSLLTENKGPQRIPVKTLALCVILLIAIPEFLYAKDIYPDHPRANTMFKLTYQASILIGLLIGACMGRLFDFHRRLYAWWRIPTGITMIGLLAGVMIYPTEAFPNFYGNFLTYKGLDGEYFLKEKTPEKISVIRYLEAHRNGKNLVEAVGDSYSELNSISVFSSTPSIQGWRVHQWLWRGSYGPVAERETDVRTIYESKDMEAIEEVINKYNVGWIVVGHDERRTYAVSDADLQRLGEVIWFEEIYLVKLK